MPDCETCKERQTQAEPIPFIAHESAMARMERTIKRLWILLMILVVLLVGSNVAWIIYESQFVEEEWTYEATTLYAVWSGIKNRCNNPRYKHYDRYGGRGITYCQEWESFESFRDWSLSAGYKEGLSAKEQSLDRIDVDGNC